jgi:hypothetical protein
MALAITIGSFSQTLTAKGKSILAPVIGEENFSIIVYKIVSDDYLSFSSIFEGIEANFSEIAMTQPEIDSFFKHNLTWFDEKYEFKSSVPFIFIVAADSSYSIKSVFWDRDDKKAMATSIFKLDDRQFSSEAHQPLIVVKKH